MSARAGIKISVVFILLLLLHLFSEAIYHPYVGFSVLTWGEGGLDCDVQGDKAGLLATYDAVGTFQQESQRIARCVSNEFKAISNDFEIEVKLADRITPQVFDGISLEVQSNRLRFLRAVNLADPSAVTSVDGWKKFRVSLPEKFAGEMFTIKIIDSSLPNSILVRNRINFYKNALGIDLAESAVLRGAILAIVVVMLVVLLISLRQFYFTCRFRFFGFLIFFFVASVLVQMRPSVYFYWDEWHFMERLSQLGIKGAVYSHNEHFLPLFFLYYYFQTRLFSDSYLLYIICGLLIHALNAVLLLLLLSRINLLSKPFVNVRAARLLSLLFLISGLHVEVLQWAFEQSILLFICVSLVSMLAALEFADSGKFRNLIALGLSGLLAPMLFGAGFIIPFQIAFVCSLSGGASKQRLVRIVAAVVVCAVGSGFAGVAYYLNKEGAGHGIGDANMFGDPMAVLKYIFVATQLGTVLRGLGLFPTLERQAPQKLFEILSIRTDALSPEVFIAYFGLAVSVALLVVCAIEKEGRFDRIRLWVMGQLLMCSQLLLPALGRWQFGLVQSLYLRYQYGALIGLFVALLPAVSYLLSWVQCGGALEGDRKTARVPSNLVRNALHIVLVFVMSTNVYIGLQCCNVFVGAQSDNLTSRGKANRSFAFQLVEWNALLSSEGISSESSYEGKGSSLAGNQPTMPEVLTPQRHPNHIFQVLKWLNN
ncbi:MAG: hypothetical protein IT291_05755 [Deltaproteobacteria bacterium]|nr:hypothetical protein [Deltaproteobacteria bacterium]